MRCALLSAHACWGLIGACWGLIGACHPMSQPISRLCTSGTPTSTTWPAWPRPRRCSPTAPSVRTPRPSHQQRGALDALRVRGDGAMGGSRAVRWWYTGGTRAVRRAVRRWYTGGTTVGGVVHAEWLISSMPRGKVQYDRWGSGRAWRGLPSALPFLAPDAVSGIDRRALVSQLEMYPTLAYIIRMECYKSARAKVAPCR